MLLCTSLVGHVMVDGWIKNMIEKQKYLGLIFDCNLSWAHHAANVCSKMSYLLGSHHRVIDYNLMKMLLESLVLSHLSCCVAVQCPPCKYFATEI